MYTQNPSEMERKEGSVNGKKEISKARQMWRKLACAGWIYVTSP